MKKRLHWANPQLPAIGKIEKIITHEMVLMEIKTPIFLSKVALKMDIGNPIMLKKISKKSM